MTLWGEAGWSFSYLHKENRGPDYRGGISYTRAFGIGIGAERSGLFGETTADGVFVSRFENDFLMYSQNKFGWTLRRCRPQILWNWNLTDRCSPAGLGEHDRTRPRHSVPRCRARRNPYSFLGKCAAGNLHRHERQSAAEAVHRLEDRTLVCVFSLVCVRFLPVRADGVAPHRRAWRMARHLRFGRTLAPASL